MSSDVDIVAISTGMGALIVVLAEMDRDAGELGPIVAELERNDAQIEAG